MDAAPVSRAAGAYVIEDAAQALRAQRRSFRWASKAISVFQPGRRQGLSTLKVAC